MKLRAQVIGAKALESRIKVAAMVVPELVLFIRSALSTLEAAVKPLVPRDTGYLGRSLQSEVKGLTGTLSTNAPHALYVHGRPPNPPARSRPHWPPITAITPWANRHGANPYAVARGIAARGTKLVPFMSRGYRVALPAIRAMGARLAVNISRKAAS